MAESLRVFELEEQDDTLIVIPQGDAGGFRYSDVHLESNTLLHRLDDQQLKNLIVDLGRAHVLGSIIIGTLIKLARKAGDLGGKTAFCNASDEMLEVFESMNLGNLWPHFATRDEALKSVRQ